MSTCMASVIGPDCKFVVPEASRDPVLLFGFDCRTDYLLLLGFDCRTTLSEAIQGTARSEGRSSYCGFAMMQDEK